MVKNHLYFESQLDQGSTPSFIPCQLYDSGQVSLSEFQFPHLNWERQYLIYKADMRMR